MMLSTNDKIVTTKQKKTNQTQNKRDERQFLRLAEQRLIDTFKGKIEM